MVELKGKQLLASSILGLLVIGALSYGNLPQAYCPLENTTVRYIYMSDTHKTVTKVLPSKDAEEGWTILDDRCQKGIQIGEWIPLSFDLLKNCPECPFCPVECPGCPTCECKCKDCPYCDCPSSNGTCSPCVQAPCVQTCAGCGGGGGCDPCNSCCGSCAPCVDCDKVNVVAYIPNDDCSDTIKWFCDGIGKDANCINEYLEMPFD